MRKNRRNICLILIFIMSLLLGGCGNKEDNRETVEDNNETASQNPDGTESISGATEEVISEGSAYIQIYQTRKNSAGELEYGVIAEYELAEENPIFGFECTIRNNMAPEDEIYPSLIMAFYDGQPVEFSMDGGEYGLTAVKDIKNKETVLMNLCINTDKFSEMSKIGRFTLVCIPEYNKTEWNTENSIFPGGCLTIKKKIYNTFSEKENTNIEMDEMIEMDSPKEITGNDKISQMIDLFFDFVVKGIDDKYYYVYRFYNDGFNSGDMITYIMLDGQFVTAGDDLYSFRWKTNTDKKEEHWYIVHEIELPEISAGEHILNAVTINLNPDDTMIVSKSEGLKITFD